MFEKSMLTRNLVCQELKLLLHLAAPLQRQLGSSGERRVCGQWLRYLCSVSPEDCVGLRARRNQYTRVGKGGAPRTPPRRQTSNNSRREPILSFSVFAAGCLSGVCVRARNTSPRPWRAGARPGRPGGPGGPGCLLTRRVACSSGRNASARAETCTA